MSTLKASVDEHLPDIWKIRLLCSKKVYTLAASNLGVQAVCRQLSLLIQDV